MGDDVSDADGSASAAKKRGRKSVSEKPADKEDDERPTKKPRKTAEKKTDAPKTTSAEPLPDEEVGTMEEHMQAPTWDQLIKKIDTVERVDDTLFVYFTLYVSLALASVFMLHLGLQEWRRAYPRRLQNMRGQVPQNGAHLLGIYSLTIR